MKISANSIKSGNILLYNTNLYLVLKPPEHTKPGKGHAYVQVEMRNIKTDNKTKNRFTSTEYIEKVHVEQVKYQFLYLIDKTLNLMHLETFEQIEADVQNIDGDIRFLKDGMNLTANVFEDKIVNIKLPSTVITKIEQTDPVIRDATATSSYKPAIVENGIKVMVPSYITSDELIVVKTEDSSFVERYKEK